MDRKIAGRILASNKLCQFHRCTRTLKSVEATGSRTGSLQGHWHIHVVHLQSPKEDIKSKEFKVSPKPVLSTAFLKNRFIIVIIFHIYKCTYCSCLCTAGKDRTSPINSLEKMDRVFLNIRMFSLPALV